jgi:uncharacterized protein YuzB (UPF0349 family)
LDESGWLRSVREGLPVDRNGNPIPWLTYSAISFLEKKIKPHFKVFEYGSGNSTLWWANRVSWVVSCEHDRDWYDSIKDKLPSNVEYIYRVLVKGGEYSMAIMGYEGEFDIVVIDGRDRINCAMNSLGALKENGVIIWDNSDRERYQEGYAYLMQNRFKRLDFAGLAPCINFSSITSVFYRNHNCLDI